MDAEPRIFKIEPYIGRQPQIVCVDRQMGGIAVCEGKAVLELKIATLDPESEMASEKVTTFRRWTVKATLSERAPFWKLLARRLQSLLAKLPSVKQENLSIANARKKLRRSHLSRCD